MKDRDISPEAVAYFLSTDDFPSYTHEYHIPSDMLLTALEEAKEEADYSPEDMVDYKRGVYDVVEKIMKYYE